MLKACGKIANLLSESYLNLAEKITKVLHRLVVYIFESLKLWKSHYFSTNFFRKFYFDFPHKNGIILSSESLVFHSFHNTYYYNYHFLRKRI